MTFGNLEVSELQNNQNRGSEQSSIPSKSNCANSRSWRWSSSGSHVSQISYSKDVNINTDYLARHTNDIKQSRFQLLHQNSSSTQSTGQSHQERMSESNFHEQCLSSQSGTDASENQNDDMKSELPLGTSDIFPHPKLNCNQSIACFSYPYGDPYHMAVMAAYGSHVIVHPQLLGMTSALAPLPLQPAEGPIYVNPKQYHRILQRRQERAKLEAQNKIAKERRPYLHESRHNHAMKRVRGSGGRFLNTKQLQQESQTSGTMGIQDVSGYSLQRTMDSSATPTCSEVTNVSNSSDMFQQHHHGSFPVNTQSEGELMKDGVHLTGSSIRFML